MKSHTWESDTSVYIQLLDDQGKILDLVRIDKDDPRPDSVAEAAVSSLVEKIRQEGGVVDELLQQIEEAIKERQAQGD